MPSTPPPTSLARQLARNTNHQVPKVAAPDLGAASAFINSAKLAFNQSFGSALQRNGSAWMADRMSEVQGFAPLTEEQFEPYSLNGKLKWKEGVSEARAMLEAEWKNAEVWGETELSGSRHRWVSTMAGGVAGSVLHPVDIATMVLTPNVGVASKIAKIGKAGVKAENAWAKARTMGKYIYQGAKAGAIDGAWQAPAMLKFNGNIQANYTEMDAAMDLLISPLFGGVLGGVGYFGRKTVEGIDLDETFTGEDGTKTGFAALANEQVAKRLSRVREINEILSRSVDDITEVDRQTLRGLYSEDLGPLEMGAVRKVREKVESKLNSVVYKDIEARSHEGVTDTQTNMGTLMKQLFGVNVKYARMDNSHGAVFHQEANTVFISDRVAKEDLAGVVGHEFTHSLRLRDPEVFKQIADRIAALPESNKIFQEAMDEIAISYGKKRWDELSLPRKMDEGVAQSMYKVFQSDDFWKSLEGAPKLKRKIANFLTHILSQLKEFLSRNPQSHDINVLADDIGDILGKVYGSAHKQELSPEWFVSVDEQSGLMKSLVRDLQTANQSFILSHLEKGPKKKWLLEADQEVVDSFDTLYGFHENMFGIDLGKYLKKGVLYESKVVKGDELTAALKNNSKEKNTIGNITMFEDFHMGAGKGLGMPVYYRNGKVIPVSFDEKNVLVDEIRFYRQTTDKFMPPSPKELKSQESIDDAQRSKIQKELESEVMAESRGDENEAVDLDSTHSDFIKDALQTKGDLKTVLDKRAFPKRFATLRRKAEWYAARAEAELNNKLSSREAVAKGMGEMIGRAKSELRFWKGDSVSYKLNGETYVRKINEMTPNETLSAWIFYGNKRRKKMGLPELEVFPPDEFRSVDAVPLNEANAQGADVNSPERQRQRDAIRAIIGDKPDRINLIEELINNAKIAKGKKLSSEVNAELLEYNEIRKDDFFGLGEDEYWQAILNMDERLSNADDLFDTLELPRAAEWTAEAFANYRNKIKSMLDKVDKKRDNSRVSKALNAEKSMSEKAGIISDKAKRVTEMVEHEIGPDFKEYVDVMRAEMDAETRDLLAARMPVEQLQLARVLLANEGYYSSLMRRNDAGYFDTEVDMENETLPRALKDKLRPIIRNPNAEKLEKFRAIHDEKIRTQFNILNDFKLKDQMRTAARKSRNPLKWVSTKIDGLFRRDIEPDIETVKSSVESQQQARVTEDTSAVMNVIDAEGLYDAWMDDTIVADVVAYLESDRTAEVPPPVKRIGDVLHNTYKKQVNEMTAAGADVKWLKGFALTQRWDAAKIRAVSFEEFRAALIEHVDMARVNRFHETIHTDPDSYLKAVYDDLRDGSKRDAPEVEDEFYGGNIANQVSKHRALFLKEGGTFPVMSKFGRGDSVGQMILNQLSYNAERTVIMENFGSNYKKTFAELMDDPMIQNPKGKGLIARKKHEADLFITTKAFDKITGELDNPVNAKISEVYGTARRYSNIVNLWTSGISTLNDIPGIVANLQYQGVKISMLDQKFWGAIQKNFKNRKNKEAMLWLRSNGASLTSIRNNMTARVGLGDTATGKIGAWNNWMFNHNGLSFATDLGQAVFMDLTTLHLGSGEITGDMLRSLNRHGITARELGDARKKYAGKAEGYEGDRLSPDMFEHADPDLARKFRAYLEDNMRQAVIEPGVREQTIARFGTKAGQHSSEAIRMGTQYTTFPLAIQMKTIGRFMNGYGEREFGGKMTSSHNRTAYTVLSWAAAGMVMGYMSTNIKDILKGREPIHWGNMNSKNLSRIVDASGVAGIILPILYKQELPESPLMQKTREGLATLAKGEMSAYRALTTAQGLAPLSTAPLVGPGQDSIRKLLSLMIGDGMSIQYETKFQNRLDYIEQNLGQTSIFK